MAGVIQVARSREVLVVLGQHPLWSALALMGLAFVIAICSTVDAFFILSLGSAFTPGAVIAFLLFGPVIDVKMLALLRTTFTSRPWPAHNRRRPDGGRDRTGGEFCAVNPSWTAGWVAVWVLVGAVASLWLAATGKLTLYVHPRYTPLTVVMSVLAIAAVVLALAVLGGDHDEESAHDERADEDRAHEHRAGRPSRTRQLVSWCQATLLVGAALALLVVPPATLSAASRQNRDLVTSGHSINSTDTTVLAGANTATFSFKDWSALLSQGGSEALVGKDLDASGYVLDDGHDDVFYLVRLMMSCCAVDAQPVGVPVHRPGWRQEVQPSAWVSVTGTLVENTDTGADDPAVVQVASMTAIDEPDQPYVF